MSRRSLINLLSLVYQPALKQGLEKDLLGKEVKAVDLAAETTYDLDFVNEHSIVLTLGSANLTALNALVTGLKNGEKVLLTLIQDGTAARTVAWGTGFLFAGGTGPTVTASTDAIDVFEGVVVGGEIVLRVVAQNIS